MVQYFLRFYLNYSGPEEGRTKFSTCNCRTVLFSRRNFAVVIDLPFTVLLFLFLMTIYVFGYTPSYACWTMRARDLLYMLKTTTPLDLEFNILIWSHIYHYLNDYIKKLIILVALSLFFLSSWLYNPGSWSKSLA